MANPLIDLGVLNRIKASVLWTSHPELNVTASYLDKAGISLALEGEASAQLGAMTGIVQSPEPYLPIGVTIHLLKTQSLSEAYKSQMELNSLIGDGVVWPDVSTGLGQYQLANMSIQSVREIEMNGTVAGYTVSCKGTYYINSALFD